MPIARPKAKKNQGFKVALYSFFGTRGIGTNGASVPVFKKYFYFDDVTENNGF